MKLLAFIILAAILGIATSIPWSSQIALANSLEVGRNQDPMVWGCADCYDNNKPLTSVIIESRQHDVKAILSVYEEYTVLAFRYTATIKNVFQDLLWSIQVQDEHAPAGCKVQKQMDTMWNAIRSNVLDDLIKSVHTGRLIITGISLGGALSCLSYVDIAKSGLFSNIEIITFGAPRVGNAQWARWFDLTTQHQRYYINEDPIVDAPACFTVFCSYQQTGRAIKCTNQDQLCTVQKISGQKAKVYGVKFINKLANAIYDHVKGQERFDSIVDHINGYKLIYNYTLVQ